MNQPTPAIVAQAAVRRLPRLALWLLCAAYVLPGYLGREPWKNADMTAFGYMAEIARGATGWLQPRLMGLAPDADGLLAYWLGAAAVRIAPSWLAPDLAARLPFMLLLGVTLAASWWAVYYLARSPQAQPVAFAFGGEALPADYARAIADGGLLALIASLGLAQMSHETTPALAQLASLALLFHGVAALPYRPLLPPLTALLGLLGLALSGAPAVALVLGLGAAALIAFDRSPVHGHDGPLNVHRLRLAAWLAGATLLAASVAALLGEWRWQPAFPQTGSAWRSLARLLVWFTWPALALALWTVWRWRRQLASRHLAWPLGIVVAVALSALTAPAADRALLLALPPLAALAAFALPTLRRSVAALIDWFTLLFFTGCAVVIWVIWIAMQTGFPRQPAANVVKLAPGFTPSFSLGALIVALAATLAWCWLVKWRVGRHQRALWKSLVLPASGAVLSWLLLTTLWLPLLNFSLSYGPLVQAITPTLGRATCAETHGLTRAQIAAFRFYSPLTLQPTGDATHCDWLLVNDSALSTLPTATTTGEWTLQSRVRHPTDRDKNMLVYRRTLPVANP
ncbi:MAG: hypothetical protein KA795_10105 [Burkholderiaceae bacterium]|nr:hypothetical protein [Burkholderiaceae bacterium]